MKKTLTFLLLVFFSMGIFAQKDVQQEITTLKKQVGSLKFENNKLKKLINDTSVNLNLKILSLEKLLSSTSNNVKKQATTLEKNNTSISELKEEFNAKNNFTKILTWSCLILLLIVFVYVLFINMKWNKSKEEMIAQMNSMRQALDNHIIQVNGSIETKFNQNRKELLDQLDADKKAMENMISNHYKTTNEGMQAINNSMLEYKNSGMEQTDILRKSMENQNLLISAQKNDLDKQKLLIKEHEKLLESNKAAIENQKSSLENTLKTETSIIISDMNKTFSTLKTEMEKLRHEKADANNNLKNSKNTKKE